jgi:hypothetical protein
MDLRVFRLVLEGTAQSFGFFSGDGAGEVRMTDMQFSGLRPYTGLGYLHPPVVPVHRPRKRLSLRSCRRRLNR